MYHILVVDDEARIRSIVRKYAEFEGHTVTEAGDGMQAVHLCRKEKFDIILLDPPYAEVFLENALKCIAEIDILQSNGIIVCERPVDKVLDLQFDGYTRSKDYKYGSTLITLYRKD